LIYIQSAYPTSENIPDLPFFDKVLHFAVYALLSILFFRAYRTTRIKAHVKLVMFVSILSSALYGISDEIHQHFVSFRHADFLDVLADIFGSIFGVYFYQFILSNASGSNRDRILKS
jgi:VanZ family protein